MVCLRLVSLWFSSSQFYFALLVLNYIHYGLLVVSFTSVCLRVRYTLVCLQLVLLWFACGYVLFLDKGNSIIYVEKP